LNQRDDLLLQPGDRKISGTAARIAHGRAYHHLTLLVRPDLPLLRRVLRSPFVDKVETNATRSVQAKSVGQLIDVVPNLEVSSVVDLLLKGFGDLSDRVEVFDVDSNEIVNEAKYNGVTQKKEQLKSSEWIFAKSPRFSILLPDSNRNLKKLVVESGRVIESENDLYEIGLLFDRIKVK
jgi:lipoate-protein ligase A